MNHTEREGADHEEEVSNSDCLIASINDCCAPRSERNCCYTGGRQDDGGRGKDVLYERRVRAFHGPVEPSAGAEVHRVCRRQERRSYPRRGHRDRIARLRA